MHGYRCSVASLLTVLMALLPQPAPAAELAPAVQAFSPTGSVKGVRQVQVRFSEQMIPFGDPRLPDPFVVECPAPGHARWVDGRNWIFDFARALPAGVRCRFELKPGLSTLAGTPLAGPTKFSFDTGGPAVIQSEPWEGNQIDEEQIFILGLDAPATAASIDRSVQCRADGVTEAIGVRLVTGEPRTQLLAANRYFLRRYANLVSDEAADQRPEAADAARARFLALMDDPASPIVLVQCKQRLPNGAKVYLDWGAGVTTLTGVPSAAMQTLAFETRAAFRARVNCERVNKDADCIPALDLRIDFSAPIRRADAAAITLTGADGKAYPTQPDGDVDQEFVAGARIKGPFPERSKFILALPEDLKDDAGRALANQSAFPHSVETDEDPPLAKFAASFGIIELEGGAALPVTVRNLEANIAKPSARAPRVDKPGVAGFIRDLLGGEVRDEAAPIRAALHGRMLKIPADDAPALGRWFHALGEARRDHYEYDEQSGDYVLKRRAGEMSILDAERGAMPLTIPRKAHARAFEVIGIPLAAPGFYIVELASPKLGAALFGKPGTYYVQSLALVTNLGVHFKWGRESSLVWVTALDSGRPVAGAAVTVRDCAGKKLWQGKSDPRGVAAIEAELPRSSALPHCDWNSQGYLVSAKLGADIGFVSSEWNSGIANWQFGLPSGNGNAPQLATTVFDRTLLRAGESVHMKHFLRHHTRGGFAPWRPDPFKIRIRHEGSNDSFDAAASLDAPTSSGESTWRIPDDAKQGNYQVELASGGHWQPTGSFRVESFRVPLMRAVLQATPNPAINAERLDIDVQVNYLAGGGASELGVRLRGLAEPRTVSFADYEDFVFMNGNVQEGLFDQAEQAWRVRPDGSNAADSRASRLLETLSARLDASGGGRLTLAAIPRRETPQTVVAELEYRDPNGETLTAATRVPVWPAEIALGLKPDGWALNRDRFRFQTLALDLRGEPRSNVAVTVDLLQRLTYSHRKRLIGGFYAYENKTEVKNIGAICSGRTDERGLLHCEAEAPVSGNVILRASAEDGAGNRSYVNRDVWIAGGEDWWYEVSNDDRMDLTPERKRYEPGETARFQVRMPFREATALVSVEREGVIDTFITALSGKSPVVEIPIAGHYAPNVFVSVLAVRGRDAAIQATAMVDLGRPAYRLGIAEIRVGWRAHELKVRVAADRPQYQVRSEAAVQIAVERADGGKLPAGAEVVLAAVDEGLLELRANDSWRLLEAMMGRRGAEVQTSTAQMQIVGKRHYGRKAVTQGGGGGSASGTRSLFDTLLAWQARVALDANGEATVTVPLNDSLSSFRIVAVATAGSGHFGTGATSIRTTQELMLFSGLPSLVREEDRFRATFTLKNAAERPLTVQVDANVAATGADGQRAPIAPLAAQAITLAPGQSQEISWDVVAPLAATALAWEVRAFDPGDPAIRDALSTAQQVVARVPVRTIAATIAQLDAPIALEVRIPAGAIPGRGDIALGLRPRLADQLGGVREYMTAYDYNCLEQLVSKAVTLEDAARWRAVIDMLPAMLDADGLAKYFAVAGPGSDTLTAYILALAHAAGREIPEALRLRMREGLRAFVEGRIVRDSPLSAADLTLRKLAAMEALSRYPEGIDASWFDSLDVTPELWPTSGLIDLIDILRRSEALPDRERRLAEAKGLLRARIDFQGTAMRFSSEHNDALWWLMISADLNANRALLSVLDDPAWAEDVPRLVVGSLARQRYGRWSTTTANAWGAVAMKQFSARFETTPVTGTTEAMLGGIARSADWSTAAAGLGLSFAWPAGSDTLEVRHQGAGKPWLTVQSRAAIPLAQALASGYRIRRSVTPVSQQTPGQWRRGDVYRIQLDIDAAADMTWIVVRDPVPAGASILGTGLDRDSLMMTHDEARTGWVWPTVEERTFESFRAYYEFVPRGRWTIEYTVRLNNPGEFSLPETRVEALYAPEMFGELPNDPLTVLP